MGTSAIGIRATEEGIRRVDLDLDLDLSLGLASVHTAIVEDTITEEDTTTKIAMVDTGIKQAIQDSYN